MSLTPKQQEELLQYYAPTLHFAKGEKFYPMKVDDYLDGCVLKDNHGSLTGPPVKRDELVKDRSELFLHYVHGNRLFKLYRWLVFLFLIALLAVIWFNIQPERMDFRELSYLHLRPVAADTFLEKWLPVNYSDDRVYLDMQFSWPDLWSNPWDDLRLFVVGLVIVLWPLRPGNRRVHLVLTIAIALILFLGTLVGSALGLVASIITFFLYLAYFQNIFIKIAPRRVVQFQQQASKHIETAMRSIQKPPSLWSRFLRNLLLVLPATLLILIVPYIVVRALDSLMDFNRALLIEGLTDRVPFDFVTMLSLTLSFLIMIMGIWSACNVAIRWVIEKVVDRKNESENNVFLVEELPSAVILFVSLLIILLLCLLFENQGVFIERRINHTSSLAHLILIAVAFSVMLWFFVQPILDLRQEIRHSVGKRSDNLRTAVFSLGGLLFYMVVNTLLGLLQLDWYRHFLESTPGNIIIIQILFGISSVLIILLTLGLMGPSIAGHFIDISSSELDSVARQAYQKYRTKMDTKEEEEKYLYHGQVAVQDRWTSLQYHYFYAFNDWRSACGGLNQHEGDWEAVAIFLRNPSPGEDGKPEKYQPVGVAYSQHHHGKLRFWDEINREDTHPHVYVALGSHANYFEPDEYSTSMLVSGGMSALVDRIDGIVRWFRGEDSGLPKEITEDDGKEISTWKCELITDIEPAWVAYQGLWGNKTGHDDESGPRGPKWGRPKKTVPKKSLPKRPRWEVHTWKDILLLEITQDEQLPVDERRKALQHLLVSRERKQKINHDLS